MMGTRRESLAPRTRMKSGTQPGLNFSHRFGVQVEGNLLVRHCIGRPREERGRGGTIMEYKRMRVLVTGVAAVAIGIYREIGFSGDTYPAKSAPLVFPVPIGP